MNASPDDLWNNDPAQRLSETLAGICDVQTMQNFLRDVMTENEILDVSARFEAARLLQEGVSYSEITRRTKLSSRTIARISDWLQNGCGGYEAALQLVHQHHGHMSPARAG